MNNHFAELGDVWKHLPLAEILRITPPRDYWETHAGSASYALTESPSSLQHGSRGLGIGSSSGTDMTVSSGVVGRTTRSRGSPRASTYGVETRSCRLASFTLGRPELGVVGWCWQMSHVRRRTPVNDLGAHSSESARRMQWKTTIRLN